MRDICAISSVLVSPTDPAEANATNYIVSVDGSEVPLKRRESVSSNGVRYSTLVYESSCGAHDITIAANNTCGRSLGMYEITLDPGRRFVLNVDGPTCPAIVVTHINSANNMHSKLLS